VLASLPVEALDNAKYLTHCERSADRAALLVGGDAKVIAGVAKARGDGVQHLIRTVGHPLWMATRVKIGVAGK